MSIASAAGNGYLLRHMNLAGQSALVVGGGTGMGEAIALALAAEGMHVAIAGRRQEKLDAVAAQSEKRILTKTADVGDRESVRRLFDWFAERFDRLHLLVNSAGINVPKRSMSELAPEDWDKLMRINATGAYNCLHFGLPLMRPHKEGLVINISSIAGLRAGHLGGVAYNASKFAMNALGTSAAGDELENKIRITTICPGSEGGRRPKRPPFRTIGTLRPTAEAASKGTFTNSGNPRTPAAACPSSVLRASARPAGVLSATFPTIPIGNRTTFQGSKVTRPIPAGVTLPRSGAVKSSCPSSRSCCARARSARLPGSSS